jgi:rhodanese-related sulfurtransferase
MNSSRRNVVVIVLLLTALGIGAQIVMASHGVEDLLNNVAAERLKSLMDAGEKLILFDLRPAKEFQAQRLPGARSLPLAEFDKRDNEVPRSGQVILYCDCLLYQLAEKFQRLASQGYRNVGVMLDGYHGWVKLGYPIETGRK